MIIVGLENKTDGARDALAFIQEVGKNHGITIDHIAQDRTTIYKNNKILSLGKYIEYLKRTKKIDLLLIEFNKNSKWHTPYRSIPFDMMVLFDDCHFNQKAMREKACLEHKILRHLKPQYYLVPDTYQFKPKESITYGWSPQADISLSSNAIDPQGNTEIQCCMQTCIPTINKSFTIPSEFPVSGKVQRPEDLLAGIGVLVLCGIETKSFVLENNKSR